MAEETKLFTERITVDRTKLLDKVKKNLEIYKDLYQSSVDAYWKLAERKLANMLERTKQHRKIEPYLNISFPTNHKEDYELIISMLEFSEDEKVILTPQEFSKYVLNNWSWRKDFITQTTTYVSGLSMSGSSGSAGSSGSSGRSYQIEDNEIDVDDEDLIILMDNLNKF